MLSKPRSQTQRLEPGQLFCDDDQAPLCDKCEQSKGHGQHTVSGPDEAIEYYLTVFRERLDMWKKQYKAIEILLANEQARMVGLQERMNQRRASVASVSRQVGSLRVSIAELEKKPAFPQIAKSSLERSESLFPLGLEPVQFTDLCLFQVVGMSTRLTMLYRHITLDPATAHPHLAVSSDLRNVSFRNNQQAASGNPGKFDFSAIVFAAENFISGRHYWEVDVEKAVHWQIGICKDRTTKLSKVPKTGGEKFLLTRSVMGANNTFWVYPPLKRISVKKPVHKVGVFLDYEHGQVSFYNVTDKSHIYSFSGINFRGTIRPMFSLCITNEGINSDSLTICAPPEPSSNGAAAATAASP
ncbi:putative E3 ubiquitin-protein ligase TRIML2 [Tenrec ecaudatus]|uniref:putative E3 ubiquitin-protein ligase TRIML2 n=1 Tax=Tenrec ecaudatus TaxID=94439 RepID=UPI003F5A48E8